MDEAQVVERLEDLYALLVVNYIEWDIESSHLVALEHAVSALEDM